jgi:hypothetical protein
MYVADYIGILIFYLFTSHKMFIKHLLNQQ